MGTSRVATKPGILEKLGILQLKLNDLRDTCNLEIKIKPGILTKSH